MVGQQFIARLAGHPWFNVSWLAASERSEGKSLRGRGAVAAGDADAGAVAAMTVDACVPGRGPKVVFSALDAKAADELEHAVRRGRPRRAQQRAHVTAWIRSCRCSFPSQRRSPGLLAEQRRAKGWSGAIVTNPELRDGRARDGARAAPPVRHPPRARDDDAGGVGRGLSGRARRSTSSATSFRSSAAAKKRRSRPRR